MWIQRAVTPRLDQLIRQFPAVLLTGARQTGKTALLRHSYPRAEFVSLDLPSIAAQAENEPEAFFAGQREPVIIDEVQYAPALFRHLKARIDAQRHQMGRFLMTGSQKFALMQSVSESLAGRCAILELEPLMASEILAAALPSQAPDTKTLLWRGGFPELFRNPEMDSREYYRSYVASCLERDVRLAVRAGSLRDFERFLRACALRSGQLLNLADLARDVGISGTTARDWLSVLEASNHIVLLEPYFGNATKRLIKTPKLYFRDSGLLCFFLALDSPDALDRSPSVGMLWETFVLGEILRQRSASGHVGSVFFWRDVTGTEVDFVIEHQDRLRLVEAKWTEGAVEPKSLAGLLKVKALCGVRATDEHWVATRTKYPHRLPGLRDVRQINAVGFDWFAPSIK
jgi:predicted AAA+ superfamily ATPase